VSAAALDEGEHAVVGVELSLFDLDEVSCGGGACLAGGQGPGGLVVAVVASQEGRGAGMDGGGWRATSAPPGVRVTMTSSVSVRTWTFLPMARGCTE
jgi:hypothetical protein